jgi:hypothetical protein
MTVLSFKSELSVPSSQFSVFGAIKWIDSGMISEFRVDKEKPSRLAGLSAVAFTDN